MKWHKKADLQALFGEKGRKEILESPSISEEGRGRDLGISGGLLAPASPLNPPGPTALAPRPGPMSVGPVLPPKPLPTKRIREKRDNQEVNEKSDSGAESVERA